ncbi:hypothetical protein Aasi_0712 [Candidatus Amoebophilus asiaticus 5a2]|uniref:Uncharacterized protein n=1 Tax=Amoebophilus asiaticus (strain 5a2) TaxID=452471 RepID=B3ES97_AMOA5|nr:hypothetical protein Aasi_0712 [Candidatus Amoebophilus asiaticus 5a2]
MSVVSKSITSIAEIHPFIVQGAIEKSQLLVVFDMDLTLTMPPLPALLYLAKPEYRTKVQRILSPLTDTDRAKVLTLGLQISEHQLIEEITPSIIESIQALQVKSIVLTASLSGQFNNNAPLELQRFQKLKELGIVLQNISLQEKVILTDLPFCDQNYPTYYNGILCVRGEPKTNIKGPTLVSFLHHIHFYPKQIIMVDDKREHLSYVQQSLAALEPTIEFIGFEYTGAYKRIPPVINEESFLSYWEGLIKQVLDS